MEGVFAGAGVDLEEGDMGQILGQLKKGRSMAIIEQMNVLAYWIKDVPGDAADKLQLSLEGNIPLVCEAKYLGAKRCSTN